MLFRGPKEEQRNQEEFYAEEETVTLIFQNSLVMVFQKSIEAIYKNWLKSCNGQEVLMSSTHNSISKAFSKGKEGNYRKNSALAPSKSTNIKYSTLQCHSLIKISWKKLSNELESFAQPDVLTSVPQNNKIIAFRRGKDRTYNLKIKSTPNKEQ